MFTPHTAAFSSTWIFLDFASLMSAILMQLLIIAADGLPLPARAPPAQHVEQEARCRVAAQQLRAGEFLATFPARQIYRVRIVQGNLSRSCCSRVRTPKSPAWLRRLATYAES